MNKVFLSIVVPVYNEEKVIGETLEIIDDYVSRQSYEGELIIVDDGSCDRTGEIIAGYKERSRISIRIIRNEENKGKGNAVKQGMLASKGSYIVFLDADNSIPVSELEKVWEYFDNNFDIVIGSKALQKVKISKEHPLNRYIMSKVFNLCVRAIGVKGIPDTQCGFKVFKQDVAQTLFPLQIIDGWGFDVEILYLAQKFKYNVAQIAVKWSYHSRTHVKYFKDSIKILIEIILIRLNDARKKYSRSYTRE